MSGNQKVDGQRAKVRGRPTARQESASARKKPPTTDLGSALRSAYDDALREEIPSDLRNLLDKLS